MKETRKEWYEQVAKCLIAMSEGKAIQCCVKESGDWVPKNNFDDYVCFHKNYNYRIKPEPKIRFDIAGRSFSLESDAKTYRDRKCYSDTPIIKLIEDLSYEKEQSYHE